VIRARRGAARLLILLSALIATSILGSSAASATPIGQTKVFVVDHASFEDLMAMPAVAELATRGGAGLMPLDPSLRLLPALGYRATGAGGFAVELLTVPSSGPGRAAAFAMADARIAESIREEGDARIAVFVFSTTSSASMVAGKDELHPIVFALGSDLLPRENVRLPRRSPNALTSDSTRRDGVVAEVDLATTMFRRGGLVVPGQASGQPFRVVDEGPPFQLHERYLTMRRMTVPIQTAAALYVTIAGLFCIAVVALGRRVPRPVALVATGAAVSVGPLAAALLVAGHLPSLSYAAVVTFVVLATLVVSGLVVLGAEVEVIHPLCPLGVVLLAVLAVEAILGWTAALTPFLGGSELDGGRFYGLPNVFIGLLLGASLYAAQRLEPRAGFVLLIAAGLFAGLPYVGANLGGAVTLFAAAGLWFPLRSRGRLGWPELAFATVIVVAGTAVVLLANRFSPVPTHITNFEVHGGGISGAWRTVVDRLGVGVRLIEHNPFALVPVVGVLATLAVVLRPPFPIGPSLEGHPALRDALLVLLLASVVAYVVNDSGPAACGVGFGMALGCLLYVSVAERTWKVTSEPQDQM
jgi:hypothetical protein